MDEIIIEEKKYISSKQAAKITGYAKDYIGQLCREGRVPARLVGRNWYVLETAIQDHRFGDSEAEQEAIIKKETKEEAKIESPATILPTTWEMPRYEAISEEVISPTNKINNLSQDMQESWKAWFDRFDHTTEDVEDVGDDTKLEDDIKPEEPELEPEEIESEEIEQAPEENMAVDIPIRNMVSTHKIPTELLPHHEEQDVYYYKEQKEKKGSGMMIKTIQVAGLLLAIITFAVAVIGSGYFDKYTLSNSQFRMIAGAVVYNRHSK